MPPDSGSGPEACNGDERGLPEGWRWVDPAVISGQRPFGLITPDPEHLLYREIAQRNARRASDTRHRLESDSELNAALNDLQAHFKPIIQEYQRILETKGQAAALRFIAPQMPTMTTAVIDAANQVGKATGLTAHIRATYLTTKILPATIYERGDGDWESITLVANASRTREPLSLGLAYGEIVMRFTNASGRDRKALGTLIARAQAAFDHISTEGGRSSGEDDPVKAEQARTAAKLHHWRGWSHDEIASLFGWQGERNSLRERVRLTVRRGEGLLGEDPNFGSRWMHNPPSTLKEER